MNSRRLNTFFVSLCALLCIAMSSQTFAQSNGGSAPVTPAPSASSAQIIVLLQSIYNSLNGFQDGYSPTTFENVVVNGPVPNQQMVTGNSLLPAMFEIALGIAQANDIVDVKTILTNSDPSITLIKYTAQIPGSDFPIQLATYNQYTHTYPRLTNPDNAAFNFSTLIGTNIFPYEDVNKNTITASLAQDFVTYVSGQADPFPIPTQLVPKDASQANSAAFQKQLKGYMGDANVQAFLANLRTYTANVSVGLANLNRMVAERTAIPNLAQEAGLLPTNVTGYPNASPLQVDKFLATRRMNQAWYDDVETASPVRVNKEILYVLSEMRYEMFQQRQEIKRLSATMSVIVLQGTQAAKALLSQQSSQLKLGTNS